MNIIAPVSSIMTKKLITVNPKDSLTEVKAKFDDHNIHHLPVVRGSEILGILSSTDFNHFLHGFGHTKGDKLTEDLRMRSWKVEEIMTDKLAKLESSDPIRTALEVFKTNRIHALPVVDDGELVGILTTYDIISLLATELTTLEDYAK